MGEEDGAVDGVGHLALGGLGNVVAKDVRLVLLVEDGRVLGVEPVNGVAVLHAHKGTLGTGKGWVELLEEGRRLGVAEHAVDDAAHELLEMLEQLVKGDKVELGLDVAVLGQVASGQGLLGAEGLFDAVDVAEAGQDGLEVQLRGLGEVGLLVVVRDLEEGGAALDLGLHQGGRGDLDKLHVVVGLDERPLDLGAQLHEGGGVVTAQHQVAVVEHGLVPLVLGEGDLVGDGLLVAGRFANDLKVVDLQLAAVGRRLTLGNLAHLAVERQRRALRKDEGVVRLGQVTRLQDALQVAVAVNQRDESSLLLLAQAVDATRHLDAGALLVAIAQLNVLVAEANLDGRGQRGVLLQDNLLGSLEVVETGLLLGVGGGLRGLLLDKLLAVNVERALGLFHGALGRLLPGQAGGGVLAVGHGAGDGGALEELRAGAVNLLDVGERERLEGLALGAVGGRLVDADVCVDVADVAAALDPLSEFLNGSHGG